MKQKETLLNTTETNLNHEEVGDDHHSVSLKTPIRDDAFALDNGVKIEMIENHFREIMLILGLDMTDDSLKGTPHRVAKMYVQEIFSGLDPKNAPKAKLFQNKYQYKNMLVEKQINFYSTCEHHFVPIIGKAHVAYIPSGRVVGISKLNRIVRYFAQRPQVQERMTIQIADMLREVLNTEDVAVVIEADHLCVASRGVKDVTSNTITAEYSGKFADTKVREEFLSYLKMDNM